MRVDNRVNIFSSENTETLLLVVLLLCCCYGGYKSQGDPGISKPKDFLGVVSFLFMDRRVCRFDRAAVRCGCVECV